jgi:hypothetical protein
MRIPWLCKKLEDPKTPEIVAASSRAKVNEDKANSDLKQAESLASALKEIRQRNGLGESLSYVFGGGNDG